MDFLNNGPRSPGHLRVASLNVNGIRAAVRRGLHTWLADRDPDVVGLQEMRCPDEEVPDLPGYHLTHHAGVIPGRNGVAVLSRTEPVAVRRGTGSREFDREGRYVEVDLDLPPAPDHPRAGVPGTIRGLSVGSLYLPKGGTPYEDEASLAKHERKLRFCRHFRTYLTRARRAAARAGREFLVVGDWNVAPSELDLHNWRTNRRSEGFLPVERDWIASLTSPRTLTDVVRRLHPQTPGPYSWWSWRGQSFANDVGWRIDHQLASPALAASAVAGGTDREPSYEARKSDHSPVVVDYHL